MEIQKRIRVT